MNPFVAAASGSRMGRPLQTAYGELFRHIGLQTPIVVVVGTAGTGKSLLMDITARALAGMGLSVRRIERGDLLSQAFGEKTDVLMVDQSDSHDQFQPANLAVGGPQEHGDHQGVHVPSDLRRQV